MTNNSKNVTVADVGFSVAGVDRMGRNLTRFLFGKKSQMGPLCVGAGVVVAAGGGGGLGEHAGGVPF